MSNLKAYIRLRAREVSEVPRPVEFKGHITNDMMEPGEQLAWRTWGCVNQSQSAYAKRCAGSSGNTRQTDQQHATLEEATEALGDNFVWRRPKFRVVGGNVAMAGVPRGIDRR